MKCIKTRQSRKKKETEDDKYTSWERDFDLVDFPIHGLYEEYLEMGGYLRRPSQTQYYIATLWERGVLCHTHCFSDSTFLLCVA